MPAKAGIFFCEKSFTCQEKIIDKHSQSMYNHLSVIKSQDTWFNQYSYIVS